jgi:hypothetical protein
MASVLSPQVIEAAAQVGSGVVYEQVSQSLGLAIQTSAVYLGQMLTLNAVVTAKVAEMLLATEGAQPTPNTLAVLLPLLTQAVSFGNSNLQQVGSTTATILQNLKSLLA